MNAKKPQFPADAAESERRKNLTNGEVKDLELAGGVEGGMQAGSAGGPGEEDVEPPKEDRSRQSSRRTDR